MGSENSVLVTGASGVLGWHVSVELVQNGIPVLGTYATQAPRFEGLETVPLQLEDGQSIARVAALGPFRAVVHAAAMTRPAQCQTDPQGASRINTLGTQRLLAEIPNTGPFVFLSTDLVFDGLRGHYSEGDQATAAHVYAKSKLAGEESVLKESKGVVLRIAKLFGPGTPAHPCFVTWMYDRFRQGSQVPLFVDQNRSFLFVCDAASAIRRLIEGYPKRPLYHLGGPERLSRLEFGVRFAREFGFDQGLIHPISTAAMPDMSQGPDCSLDSTRFRQEFDFSGTPLKDALQWTKEKIR